MDKPKYKRRPKEVIKDKYVQIRISQEDKNVLMQIVKDRNTTISKLIMSEIIYKNQ